MQEIIKEYNQCIDKELRHFIHEVLSGVDVLPITVGFVNSKMATEIEALTGISTIGNRIILKPDDIRHIINRHGINGKADQSMSDYDDIARLSYVLANYDSIEWDGGLSNHYKTADGKKAPQITIKKRVNGTYYIIQIVSDSSKRRNVVTTIRLTKATS